MSRHPLRLALTDATARLEAAGVPNARTDAELLAAHLLGTSRTRLGLVPLVDGDIVERLDEMVARRAERIPLQYILGTAAVGAIDVEVGEGVFVPRPETELLLEWALSHLQRVTDRAPVVLDLCTGSGALALAIAHERPDAVVHAVELDSAALSWARRNARAREAAGDTPVHLHQGDVTQRELLTALEGRVDVVVANPPYVPEGADLEPEVADHDPHLALFGGADGLSVIKPMVSNIARWLRIGGAAGIEHDDSHGERVAELFSQRRVFGNVSEHADLAGRPRFVVAHRVATAVESQRMSQTGGRVLGGPKPERTEPVPEPSAQPSSAD
ncbi:peptide chain release factor N(5)-glutamine methyltransferase [Rhodococcus rhodnii]|uniref:Release factor glutamine methyltransferase n=2 Tax=Rhodococcus rhodnii TaxID=38312 RepID=R7WLQ4_9NOCA|nr:peptide chain release factor N(5)-glutamine methyltransferase [Rhodococcus rhodnii]EOM74929.1 HemK family methyltransferase [Rhodococcus rhodnii LMG 5362]TXG91636.1 peptide chain release factor N(5)-glutamine methyltransferase [Rhodococcus rhodnii]